MYFCGYFILSNDSNWEFIYILPIFEVICGQNLGIWPPGCLYIGRVTTTPKNPPNELGPPRNPPNDKTPPKNPPNTPQLHPQTPKWNCVFLPHICCGWKWTQNFLILQLYLRSHQILSSQSPNPKIFACGTLTFRLSISPSEFQWTQNLNTYYYFISGATKSCRRMVKILKFSPAAH